MDFTEGSAENDDKIMFVKTLAKYKVLLSTGIAPEEIKKRNEALIKLTNEFSKKSKQNLSELQIYGRIQNAKKKLKQKTYRISIKNEELEYKDWEKMFLDLWVGGDTSSLLPNKSIILATEVNEKEPKDPEMNIKTEDYVLQDNSLSTEARKRIWVIDSEPETQFPDRENTNPSKKMRYSVEQKKIEDEIYENMSLEDLKRTSFIAQIKTLKAQEDAALADEKLKLYKLLLLKQLGEETF